jgi:hypothetical protein
VGQSVGRLGEERRLGREFCDARLRGGQLLGGGGDVAFYLGEPSLRGGDPGQGSERGEPLLVPAAALGQGMPRLLLRVLGSVGGGAPRGVLGMGMFGGPAGNDVERPPQCGPVIEPAGGSGEPAGLGGQVR